MSDSSIPTDPSDRLEAARAKAAERGIGGYGRHIFLCTGPDCCTPDEGAAAWARLKVACANLNKTGGDSDSPQVYRSKVGCLRICESGPVAVIYPEGTWYGGLTPAALDRVIAEDLGHGQVVEEHIIGRNPLG